MKLIKTRYYLVIALIGIVGLIMGGFFDKQVSEALYANGSLRGVGLIISNFALIPFFIVACIAAFLGCLILIKDGERYHKAFRIIFVIIFILAAGFCLYQEYDKIKDINLAYGKVAGLIAGIASPVLTLSLACYLAYLLYKKCDHVLAFRLIIAYLVIYLVSLLLAEGIKFLWSRPRPVYVYGDGLTPSHLAEYRNFWEPQAFAIFSKAGDKEYFKSFPSNHVNTGAMFLPALLLFTKLSKRLDSNFVRGIIVLCTVVFAVLIGVNRIICGMHFLSDVSFGFILTFSVSYFGFISLENINKHYHFFPEGK